MTPRTQKYLADAQKAAIAIVEFLETKSLEDFKNNLLLLSAVERQLIIAGEALNLASQEKEDLELDIPDLWKIVGLRNRLVHGYDIIRAEILWDVCKEKIPLLQKRLMELL